MNREQYDRSKIEAGVLRACHKRPIPAEKNYSLIDEVEAEIIREKEETTELPARVCLFQGLPKEIRWS